MNKYKLYMILGIIVLVLSVGSSFAYYIWKSTSNALVNLNVCTPTITFAGGSTINGVDMIPVLTKEEGTIYLEVPCDIPDYGLQESIEKIIEAKCILDNNSNEGLNDLYIVEDKSGNLSIMT